MRGVVLMYHEVHAAERLASTYPASIDAYAISERLFREHIAAIRANGLRVCTAGEFISLRETKEDSVVISFDDGWLGSLTRATEILTAAGLRATFFITRDFIGRADFATKDDLRRAVAMGMELGAHGTTHRYLAHGRAEEIRKEFVEVKRFLEDVTGSSVRTASVPGGDWSATLARVVEDCGFDGLYTSYPGVNGPRTDRFRLYRMPIRKGMSAETIAGYLRFAVSGEIVRHRLLELPKRVLGIERYARIRRFLLRHSPPTSRVTRP